jgi:hypothetical protein
VTARSFIIRIWIEHGMKESTLPVWRGEIEVVSTGEKVYFNHLSQMVTQLAPWIQSMGVDVDQPKP